MANRPMKVKPKRRRKVDKNPPIKLSGKVWAWGLLAEANYLPDKGLGENIPSTGDLRIWPLDRSIQKEKLGFFRASIYGGEKWRALSLRDGIGDVERAAYESLDEIILLYRRIARTVGELARSANCTCVWGQSSYFVPNRKMIVRLVTHAKDENPASAIEQPQPTALDLLRQERQKNEKRDPAITLSGVVWAHARLTEVAHDVALGDQTPTNGDIRLWPLDHHVDSRKRGLLVGSVFDGKRWRSLNLKGGIFEIVDTSYLGQQELLGVFRRIARLVKRHVEDGANRKAFSGGSHYFVLSDSLLEEFLLVDERVLEVAPSAVPNQSVGESLDAASSTSESGSLDATAPAGASAEPPSELFELVSPTQTPARTQRKTKRKAETKSKRKPKRRKDAGESETLPLLPWIA